MDPERSAVRIDEIEIRPLDPPASRIADVVTRTVSRRVSVPCRRGRPLTLAGIPKLAHRDQADADALLKVVSEADLRDSTALVALTSADLGHPLFTFFFGRAEAGGSAVVSVARLDPRFHGDLADDDVLIRRASAEVLHELGHVGGLLHCPDFACVMRFTGDVEMLDVRGEDFCESCRRRAPVGLVPRSAHPAPRLP